ncbi:response regulator transcription factor [Rubrolithibacter danxiaensis]|uniref:response regulator transcription factor n=1 Tax=Rubrolithibacter danxiaensis TaxID=3390805 RepID=UPI003BF806AA
MPNILIIEDEELMLKTLEFRLKKDGYKVLSAQDGKLGMELFESQPVDLVITDIMLPFISGLEIVSRIKSNPATQAIPVLILSGVGLEKTVLEAFELGADDFITKPFNLSELSIRVKKHIKTV